jgi:hypothetical protein
VKDKLAIELIDKWHKQAAESREEADRIRRTVKQATEAEARCNIRASTWDACAAELADRIAMPPATESRRTDSVGPPAHDVGNGTGLNERS